MRGNRGYRLVSATLNLHRSIPEVPLGNFPLQLGVGNQHASIQGSVRDGAQLFGSGVEPLQDGPAFKVDAGFGHDGIFHAFLRERTDKARGRHGHKADAALVLDEIGIFGSVPVDTVGLGPVFDLPLERLVADQAGRTEGMARDGAKVIAFIELLQDGGSFVVVSIPAHHWLFHELIGDGTKELGWNLGGLRTRHDRSECRREMIGVETIAFRCLFDFDFVILSVDVSMETIERKRSLPFREAADLPIPLLLEGQKVSLFGRKHFLVTDHASIAARKQLRRES